MSHTAITPRLDPSAWATLQSMAPPAPWEVSTVFQKEIITADRRIYTGDAYGADEFEMLASSFYQKLGEERREILKEFWRTGRAYRA